MDQITVLGRVRVPAVACGSSATSARLDRHLSVLAGPVVPQRETAEATSLMRELTARDRHAHGAGAVGSRARTSRVSLLAPLRHLRRSLFGSR